MPIVSIAAAEADLAQRDKVMKKLIARAGPCTIKRGREPHFDALVESICYQQLAGKAAFAIHTRFRALFDGNPFTPEAVLATSEATMRGAGLSGSKTASIRDLALKSSDGTVPLDRIAKLADDEIVARLSAVRGIGRWTAEMFLIFQLRRLDVWPVDDYGVRKGYALAYGLTELPEPRPLQELGERFRPYRSIAAWYCWRAVDTGGRA